MAPVPEIAELAARIDSSRAVLCQSSYLLGLRSSSLIQFSTHRVSLSIRRGECLIVRTMHVWGHYLYLGSRADGDINVA